jgi:pimeloyl-ACP methyl ester carboxylesterase
MPTTTSIQVAGKKTQLTRGGEGPPLLYLHSAGGETEWMPFHEGLAQQFSVYLPAHPGFGSSQGLDEIRDIYDLAWHYVDLLDQLGLEKVPLVGFSLGAWIAMELAILRPERVSQLVLVNAAGVRLADTKMGELFVDNFDVMRKLLFFDPDSPVVKQAMPLSTDDPRIVQWLRAREATARVAWNPYLHNPRLPAHLRRIQCPTLILWGRNDKLFPLPYGEFLAQQIPGAKLEVFDNCGHMLPFEKTEQFVETTTHFLRK